MYSVKSILVFVNVCLLSLELGAAQITGGTCSTGFPAVNSCSDDSQCPQDFLCDSNLRACCPNVPDSNKLCPNGVVALSNPAICRVSSECPTDYTCDQNLQACCLATPVTPNQGSNVQCPIGETPIGLPGAYQTCTPGVTSTCPQSYTCRLSSQLNAYFCCSSAGSSGGQCPNGAMAYNNQGQNQYCDGSPGSCPSGFSCQFSASLGRLLCCGGGSVTTGRSCPTGSVPYLLSGNSPRTCNGAFDTTCPRGYSCKTTGTSSGYTCCSTAAQTNPCPAGKTPYTRNGFPQICVKRRKEMCPTGYSCEDTGRIGIRRYACCSTSGRFVG